MIVRVLVDVAISGTDDRDAAMDLAIDEVQKCLSLSTNDNAIVTDVYEYEEG